MPITSIFLILLTFIVDFIPYYIFWLVMYGVAEMIWGVSTVASYGSEANLVFQFTMLSLLVPGTLSLVGFMQSYFVWATGARTAVGPDYDRLYPLLEEICQRGNLDVSRFRLYVQENPDVNAMAMGNKHIIITRGSLIHLNDTELIGMMAHEMGHLQHGHTMVLLFTLGMSWFAGIVCHVYNFMAFLCRLVAWIPFLGWIVNIMMWIIILQHNIFARITGFPMFFINQFGARRHEYEADRYACEIGLGKNLALSFCHMQLLFGEMKQGFFTNLFCDHPDMTKRIIRVEKYIGESVRETYPSLAQRSDS